MFSIFGSIIVLQAPQGGAGSGILGFLPFILIFLVIYFFMIRPQSKRQKEHQRMLGELKQGDEVVTIGGVHGTIAGIREQDNTLIVKINDTNKIIVDRSAIARIGGKENPVPPAKT
ncbi:preprotein translocase subunit YajC [bacterium]|nr:preprotein translocase subunit YajC [bacterium]